MKDDKRQAALIAKYGSLEAYQEAAREWGARGGRKSGANKTSGAFKFTAEQRSAAGKKGYQAMLEKKLAELKEARGE